MNSDEVSFAIKATKDAGDVDELYRDAWELLAATIKKNTKHASAAEVLRDYLFETRSAARAGRTRRRSGSSS